MKKCLLLILVIIITVSCEKQRIEVLNENEVEYFNIAELDSGFSNDKLLSHIKPDSYADKFKSENKNSAVRFYFHYEIFIDENGNTEKIRPINKIPADVILGPDSVEFKLNTKEMTEGYAKILENEKFPVGYKNGKPVKYSFISEWGIVSAGEKDDSKQQIISSDFFVAVDESPGPVGGMEAIQKKITYPEIAKRAGIQGKVFVKAYVDESGNVVKVEILKKAHPALDSAAVDAVMKTKFNPGRQKGKPVKTQISIPIVFALK